MPGCGRAALVAALVGSFHFASVLADEDLAKRVKELEAQVAELKSQLHAPSARDVDAVVSAIVKDADRRSKLFSNDTQATAGYDEDGFFIRTGVFEMRPSILAIFRNTTSLAQDAKHSGGDAWDNGFEFRRVELEFEGTVFSPNLYYDVVWKSPPSGGELVLDEAFVIYSFAGTPWAIKSCAWNHDDGDQFNPGIACDNRHRISMRP